MNMRTVDRVVTPEDRSYIGRILRLSFRRKAQLAWNLRRDPEVTRVMTLPLIAAVLYVLLPLHIVPRWVPFFRRLDNLAVAALGLYLFVKLVPRSVLDEHLQRVEPRG